MAFTVVAFQREAKEMGDDASYVIMPKYPSENWQVVYLKMANDLSWNGQWSALGTDTYCSTIFLFFFLQFGIYSFLQIFKIAEERPLKRKVPPLPDFSYFDGKQTEQNEKSWTKNCVNNDVFFVF